jgi:dipeptidyl aminopeptidase/acylaminoacyl peptidase
VNTLSFRGDAAGKERVLQRLYGLETGGKWVARSVHWDGLSGSLAGTILQSEDLDEWENHLGLPKWLALTLDHIVVTAPSTAEGVHCGIELFGEIPVGVDLRGAGSRCIVELLESAEWGLLTLNPAQELREMLHAVTNLHRELVAGREVLPSQWRKMRRDAVALADSMESESLGKAMAACIEAAAWDPSTSRTVVTDTVHGWSRAMMRATKARYALPATEDARIKRLLDEVYAEAKAKGGDGVKISALKELEKKYPDDWNLFKAHLDQDQVMTTERSRLSWQLAGDTLRLALNEASATFTTIIPREHLFANPTRAAIAISPDGQWLAWLADDHGVMNLWAAPADKPDAGHQLTFDRHRGLQGFSWTYVPGLLLYSQDRDGDENWRIFGVNAANGQTRELSPAIPGVRSSVHSISRVRREEALIVMNHRDPRYPDLYRLNLITGDLTVMEQNPGFAGYMTDDRYRVLLAARSRNDGGNELLRRDEQGQWQVWLSLSEEDARNSSPTHFSADGSLLYFRDSRNRDTAALVAIDLQKDGIVVLAQDSRADIGSLITNVGDYRPLAYSVVYERRELHVLDESIRSDINFLNAQAIGEWALNSRTEDDSQWVVNAWSDVRPSASYLYDRARLTLTKLLEVRPKLAGAPLARMQSVTLKARDGLSMVSYLTIPVRQENGELSSKQPLPLVLMVHGGPWTRDGFGYDAGHQWLANRGYAVLSVNFRGSTGFGKAHVVAGDGEWGRKMDEDLEDAVDWAISRGIADPKRLAIFGASYGGYAVLSALTRYPERYACGIDVVGPSNLETLLASIPPYWEAARAMQYRAIGNPTTEEGRALLRDRSPLHRAASVRAPLLIAQGANDPRVKQAESEQMVAALKERDIPVTYALYSDEGHGFVREANRMSFNALCEQFLARHLGGREEPWTSQDFPGTSLKIVEDAERKVA